MAVDKKSFVLYTDSQGLINQLPDDVAGKLFKHIFAYVNDENPETDNILLKIAFEPIKMQLKRDLVKWEGKTEKKSESGAIGNLKRWNVDLYNRFLQKEITLEQALIIAKSRTASQPDKVRSHSVANIAVSVSDNVSVSDSVNEKKYIIINNATFSQNSKLDVQWTETVAMQSHIKPDLVMSFIDTFESHLITMQEQKKNESEFKRQFTHWLNKQDLSHFKTKRIGKTNQI